jgi:hypothetical protein
MTSLATRRTARATTRQRDAGADQRADPLRLPARPAHEIHPHALAGTAVADATELQDLFWEMHELLSDRQKATTPLSCWRY